MGPLYHLLDADERRKTLAEAYRVVKPDGLVFATFIARYAGHRDAAAHYPARAVETPELYRQIAETGLLLPRPESTAGFVAYFTHPTEVEPLCRSAGLDVAAVLGVEGVVSTDETAINALEGTAWDFWVDVNYTIAHDPTIHGAVEHLLAVCRKPRWRSVLRQIITRLDDAGIACKVVGGTSLALRGLPVPVNDIDIEMSPDDVYHFQTLFSAHVVEPVALRESAQYRSHFGRFDFDGTQVEVMGGLQFRSGERWTPSFLNTEDTVDLDAVAVRVPELEETTLAYLRRGRLDRAALCLPHCNPERFQALLRRAIDQEMF